MLDFFIFKIIVIMGLIVIFLNGLIRTKRMVESIKENDKNNKISSKIIFYYLDIFISFTILGILISIFIIFPNIEIGEFALNFSEVTNNYYKEVDKKELLQKAFNTVINELDDKYTEVLDEDFVEDLKNNINSEYGYSILENDNNVYIKDITESSIEDKGLKNGDRIIAINGNDIIRFKLRGSTRYLF